MAETHFDLEPIPTFHWADYVTFSLSIGMSGLIGVYVGIIQKKSQTTEDMLVGGKSMHPVPVALSMLASFTSATAILGTPAEMYMYGTQYSLVVVGYALAGVGCVYWLIPVFHRLDITSSYEYLEKRFGTLVRALASSAFVLMMLMYMAVVIYAPAIAFSQVTGLSTFITIIGVGVICTFYTAVGGMKAVIYTDSFQMIIILVCLIVLCIMGAVNIGDTSAMWDIISEGGRLEFDNFSVDPTTRHSFWTQSFGGCFITLNILGTNQAMIQRFLSIKTTKDAQRAVFYALFAIVLFIAITTSLGLIIYAYYADCDPLKAGQIETRDQLVPLFTMHIMGNLHGLPGIFTAAVFSGTLSAVSSGVNALAAVILTDMIRPAYLYKTGKQLSGQISTNLSKIVSMFLGLTAIGLAYIAPLLGDTLLQVSLSLFGMVGGPLLGLFSLALLFPCVNQWGALVGFLSSIAVTFWLSIGAIVNPTIPVSLPRVTTGCPVLTPDVSNITTLDYTSLPSLLDPTTDTPHQDSGSSIDDLYKLSYMWYGVLSAFVAIVVGLLVSFCTGCSSHEEVEPVLLFSYYTRCGVCFGPCGCHRCCNEIHEDHMEGSLDVKPQPTIDREDTNGHVLPEKHTQAGEHTNGIKFGSNRKSGKTNQGFVPESNSAQLVGVTRL